MIVSRNSMVEMTRALSLTKAKNSNLSWMGDFYKSPAALKSASSLTTCSGTGGGVGRCLPRAWNPFSSATQLTVNDSPSAGKL